LSDGRVSGPSARLRRPLPAAPTAIDWKSAVRKLGEFHYEISKQAVNEQLADLTPLGMQARVIPNYRGGKYEGFKLVGVRPNSFYRAVGIRSGDIIRRINDQSINSPNKALRLFEQLKKARTVRVEIERRGKPITLLFEIR
jgi:general secretion pathway protein C